jgi:HD superfamily phosphodiesterase
MNPIKASVTKAMEAYFGDDVKRISHAKGVCAYAEELLKKEGGDPTVVIAAALLHDIGIQQAERKHGSSAGKYQEIEGPPIARAILEGLGVPSGQAEEICGIIAHHHSPGTLKTTSFKVVYDADLLVNLKDDGPRTAGRNHRKSLPHRKRQGVR